MSNFPNWPKTVTGLRELELDRLVVTQEADFKADVNIDGTLNIEGDVNIGGDIHLTGSIVLPENADVLGDLHVFGKTTVEKEIFLGSAAADGRSHISTLETSPGLDIAVPVGKDLRLFSGTESSVTLDQAGVITQGTQITSGDLLETMRNQVLGQEIDLFGNVINIDGETISLNTGTSHINVVDDSIEILSPAILIGDAFDTDRIVLSAQQIELIGGQSIFLSSIEINISGLLRFGSDVEIGGKLTVAGETNLQQKLILGTDTVKGEIEGPDGLSFTVSEFDTIGFTVGFSTILNISSASLSIGVAQMNLGSTITLNTTIKGRTTTLDGATVNITSGTAVNLGTLTTTDSKLLGNTVRVEAAAILYLIGQNNIELRGPVSLTQNIDVIGTATVGKELILGGGALDHRAHIYILADAEGFDIEVPAGKNIRLMAGATQQGKIELSESKLTLQAPQIDSGDTSTLENNMDGVQIYLTGTEKITFTAPQIDSGNETTAENNMDGQQIYLTATQKITFAAPQIDSGDTTTAENNMDGQQIYLTATQRITFTAPQIDSGDTSTVENNIDGQNIYLSGTSKIELSAPMINSGVSGTTTENNIRGNNIYIAGISQVQLYANQVAIGASNTVTANITADFLNLTGRTVTTVLGPTIRIGNTSTNVLDLYAVNITIRASTKILLEAATVEILGVLNFAGDVVLQKTLEVLGVTTLKNDLIVTGTNTTSIVAPHIIIGNKSTTNPVDIFGNNINISALTKILLEASTIEIRGTLSFADAVVFQGALTVKGLTTLEQGLRITGGTTNIGGTNTTITSSTIDFGDSLTTSIESTALTQNITGINAVNIKGTSPAASTITLETTSAVGTINLRGTGGTQTIALSTTGATGNINLNAAGAVGNIGIRAEGAEGGIILASTAAAGNIALSATGLSGGIALNTTGGTSNIGITSAGASGAIAITASGAAGNIAVTSAGGEGSIAVTSAGGAGAIALTATGGAGNIALTAAGGEGGVAISSAGGASAIALTSTGASGAITIACQGGSGGINLLTTGAGVGNILLNSLGPVSNIELLASGAQGGVIMNALGATGFVNISVEGVLGVMNILALGGESIINMTAGGADSHININAGGANATAFMTASGVSGVVGLEADGSNSSIVITTGGELLSVAANIYMEAFSLAGGNVNIDGDWVNCGGKEFSMNPNISQGASNTIARINEDGWFAGYGFEDAWGYGGADRDQKTNGSFSSPGGASFGMRCYLGEIHNQRQLYFSQTTNGSGNDTPPFWHMGPADGGTELGKKTFILSLESDILAESGVYFQVNPALGTIIKNQIVLQSSVSGNIIIKGPATVVPDYTFFLPSVSGSAGQVLVSQGGASPMIWVTPGGGGGGGGVGTVTSVAMTVPPALTVTGSPITSSGTFALSFTPGVPIPVINGGTGTTTSTGTGSVVLNQNPIFTDRVNFRSFAPQALFSPNIDNGAAYIGFFSGIAETGTRWMIGTNWDGYDDSFFITSTTYGGPVMKITQFGEVIFPGGISGTNYFAQIIHANYNGTTISSQIRVSPGTNGTEASISFYKNTNETGSDWRIGSYGSYFFIYNTILNKNFVRFQENGGIIWDEEFYIRTNGAAIQLSPVTSNTSTSILYWQNANETGNNWSTVYVAASTYFEIQYNGIMKARFYPDGGFVVSGSLFSVGPTTSQGILQTNWNGIAGGAGQIRLSPTTVGVETSIYFYLGLNATGNVWSLGTNIDGTNNFTLNYATRKVFTALAAIGFIVYDSLMVRNTVQISPATAGGSATLTFWDSPAETGGRWIVGTGSAGTNILSFWNSVRNTNVLRFLSAGNVILDDRLFIRGTGQQLSLSPGANGGESSIRFYQNITEGGSNWQVGYNISGSGESFDFRYNSTSKFRINTDGTVTIPGGVTGNNIFTTQVYMRSTANQLNLSPLTSGAEASVRFFQGPTETGTYWVVGSGTGVSNGQQDFALYNSARGVILNFGFSFGTVLRDRLHIRYTGPQIACSPLSNGLESSIKFYQNNTEGGASWFLGHNVYSSGSDTFAIGSTTKGRDVVRIFNNGDVHLGKLYVNYYSHSSTQYQQIMVSPSVNGQEATTAYWTNSGASGPFWNVGVQIASVGADKFGIYSSTAGRNVIVCDPSGSTNIVGNGYVRDRLYANWGGSNAYDQIVVSAASFANTAPVIKYTRGANDTSDFWSAGGDWRNGSKFTWYSSQSDSQLVDIDAFTGVLNARGFSQNGGPTFGYAEGTFNASVSAGNSNIQIFSQLGQYIKTGKQCCINFQVQFDIISANPNFQVIMALPFPAGDNSFCTGTLHPARSRYANGFQFPISCVTSPPPYGDSNTLYFCAANTQGSYINATNGSGFAFYGSMVYRTLN